jgi:hypothetical protein
MRPADPRAAYQADLAAKAVIGEHRRLAFERAFAGTTLRKTGSSVAKDASAIAEAGMGFASSVADACGSGLPDVVGAVPIFDAINAVLKIVGIEEGERANFELIMAEELAVLTTKGLLGIASMYTPYISTVMSGKDMVKEWVNTAVNGHKAYTLKRSIRCDVLPGDPQAAARAVRKLIARNAANSARLATIHTTKFAVDVAATAGGFGGGGAIAGPITGAAAAGAQLTNSLFLLGRDYHEMSGANRLLKAGTVPSAETLFGTYPLLGCYLIAGADDSDLLYFFMSEMGQAGWMDKVEQQKKRTLGPLQTEARKFIADSRFELDGFHGSKITILVPKKHSAAHHIKSFVSRVFL